MYCRTFCPITKGLSPLSELWSRSCSTTKPFSAIPYSPKGALPFLGHALRLRKGFNVESKKMLEEVDSPIVRVLVPGSKMVVCSDTVTPKAVRSVEGQYPIRGFEQEFKWFYKQRKEETNFAFNDGPEWREGRSILGKQLAPANVYGYVPGFNRATDRMIRNIEETQDSDGYVDNIQELIMYWSLEVGTWFSFGIDLDARSGHHSQATRLQNSLKDFITFAIRISYMAPFYKLLPSLTLRKINKSVDELYNIGREYADRHLNRILESSNKGEKYRGQSLLEQWLIEGKQTKEEAIHNACGMMAAGLDTTSNVVSFMLYELSKHKEVQDKLYDQVTGVLGKDGEPDIDTLQKMPFLMNVIKESQRVNPVIIAFSRKIVEETSILGYSIPPGTSVIYNMWAAVKDEKIFKEPNKFNPDRWSTDDISPYAVIPFGVGPRSCWGRRFAEIEMKVLLTKLSQYFIMECDDPAGIPVPFVDGGVLRPANPLRVKFIKRT